MDALVVRICLRLLDRTANQHENRITIKAFSQAGEGAEHSEADEGETHFLYM